MYSVAVLLKISLFLSPLLAHRSTMAEVQSTMAADGEAASALIEQPLPLVVTDGETTTTVIDAAVAPPNITSVLPPSTTSVLHQPARVSIVSGRPRSWKLAARTTLNGYPQFGDIEAEDLSFWLERIDDIAPSLIQQPISKLFSRRSSPRIKISLTA